MAEEVRVRIAPSPTGDPHVGTAYVALFNYAFAKKHKGKFIIRIEDTDQVRAKSSSEKMILKSMNWLGLGWDEGPDIGGPYGPYRQSERRPIYQKHAQMLVDSGKAYHCFCSAERLEAIRQKQKAEGQSIHGYDRHCRDLSSSEVAEAKAAGKNSVVRLKMPLTGMVGFVDELRGRVEFEAQRMDDQVLMKSDGFPTYHLANVVDDYLMKITHVIRAEEWISSTPKHEVLYEAFGWKKPQFIHLPLLRNSDKSKISKRKNPVALTYYQRAGILPRALVNFLANMGWSFGNDQEFFTVPEMIEKFDIKDIHLGGPVFDVVKLTWMNQQYMHKMNDAEFSKYIREEIFSEEILLKLKPLALERMTRFEQFVDNNAFFFSGALDYTIEQVLPSGKQVEEVVKCLDDLLDVLDELYDWDQIHLKDTFEKFKVSSGWKPKDLFMMIRLIVTGRKDSPPLFESIELVGREMTRYRIRDFVGKIKGVTNKD